MANVEVVNTRTALDCCISSWMVISVRLASQQPFPACYFCCCCIFKGGTGAKGKKTASTVLQADKNAVIALAVELPSDGGTGLPVEQPSEGGIGLAAKLPSEKSVQEAPTVVSSLQQWGIIEGGDRGKNDEVRSLDGREIGDLAVELPSEKSGQEAPTVVSSLQQWGIKDEQDEGKNNEVRSLDGREIVEITEASETKQNVKGPVFPTDGGGEKDKVVKSSASPKDGAGPDNGMRRVETHTADSKLEGIGALALAPGGRGDEDEAGVKKEEEEAGKEKQEEKGGKEDVKGEAGKEEEQASNESVEISEGVAASSTPSTGDMTREEEDEHWVGNGFVEALKGVSASSTSTSDIIRDKKEEQKGQKLGKENNVEMLVEIAASLTPSTTNVIREETKINEVGTGNMKILEGVAASSTPSTRDAIQEKKNKGEEGVVTGNVEVFKGTNAGSTPSTRDAIQETKTDGEEGVGTGNIEILGGAAVSSTPYTIDVIQGEEEGSVAKDRADGNVDKGAAGQATVVAVQAVRTGTEGGERLDLVMDVTDLVKKDDEIAPAVEETHEEDGKGETDEYVVEGTAETTFEGAVVNSTSNESTVGVAAFPNGAVQGSMECATTREGEGVENIVNIATWKDVPG